MPKYIDIKEFREKGYLQEANRRFFHPLGLALEIIQDQNDNEMLGGIWDFREDSEGIFYDLDHSSEKRKIAFKEKKKYIDSEFENFKKSRIEILGFDIEPVE